MVMVPIAMLIKLASWSEALSVLSGLKAGARPVILEPLPNGVSARTGRGLSVRRVVIIPRNKQSLMKWGGFGMWLDIICLRIGYGSFAVNGGVKDGVKVAKQDLAGDSSERQGADNDD